MLDMLYGETSEGRYAYSFEGFKAIPQVLPSGDTSPVTTAVATSLAYWEEVVPGALGFLVYAACSV